MQGHQETGYPIDNYGSFFGQGDGGEGAVDDLPPEVWLRILADPVVASRARGVSAALGAYGRQALDDVGLAAQRTECQSPQACTRALICAIARDDPEDLVRVLLSRVVDPTLPAVPPLSGIDYETQKDHLREALVAPLSCTVIRGSTNRPNYFFQGAPPSLGGQWTPVDMAVAFEAPRALTALASFGARPPTTTESLIDYVITRSDYGRYTPVEVDAAGNLVPPPRGVPQRHVPRVEMIQRLTRAFGRRPTLATVDRNPLTVAREAALASANAIIIRQYATDDAADNLGAGATPAQAIAMALSRHMRPVAPLPANASDDVQLRALADDLVTHIDEPWLDVIAALLEAGYSPDERACVFPLAPRDSAACNRPERAVAAELADEYETAIPNDIDAMRAAAAEGRPHTVVIRHAINALNRMLSLLVINAILDAYGPSLS
ncbi:hypothetical protein psal_cds_687 [Pandoravirus salinus]|uniref:Uncharacterized protein n=1 Tax=Pandoravirus salinus TaxID=1349410 RepID=S4W2D3_9VIRU|nr:hypothetical protein psal_cds_687 [Pandoravirus salinus]AGO84627.1 hypothetical protein psal_cds_687 [Pandoravirus salinus]